MIKSKSLRVKAERHSKMFALKSVMGGKCFLCGYDKNFAALDFHHLRDKNFLINTLTIQKNITLVYREAAKCVLLCSNCHRDIHFPSQSRRPDETKAAIDSLSLHKNNTIS
jgi:hypothetical protein